MENGLFVHELKPQKELDLSYYIEECHHSQNPKECVSLYDQWSVSYDDVMKRVEYQGPKLLIQVCLSHLGNVLAKNEKVNILEIGPGSGESGRLLKLAVEERFGKEAWKKINLDGIDGSTGMLEQARNQTPAVYRNLYHEILLPDKLSANLVPGSYDVVMGVGVFSQGHMQAEHIRHFVEPVKEKGGMIIFGCREKWYLQLNMKKKLEDLEETGVWRFVEKAVLPGYTQNGNGTYFVYERL